MDIINSTMYIVCKAFQSILVAIYSTIQNFKLPAICLEFAYYRNLIFNELNFQQDKRNILSKKMRMKVMNKCAVNIHTDYGRPEKKKPSLHGRKFNPNPKFIGNQSEVGDLKGY